MKTKKILALALAAVLLVAVTVAGTIAYLVDSTDEVKNTFTTAKVDIELDEIQDDRDFELIPGNVYAKEPYVTVVDGSEPAWVFVEVVETGDFTNIEYAVDTTEWTLLDGETGPHGGKVYYYNQRLAGGDTMYYILAGGAAGNGQVKIKTDLTNQNMPGTEPTLTFYAYACQAANVDDENTAWDNCKAAPSFPATGA